MKGMPAFRFFLSSLLLWSISGCSRPPVADPGLSEQQFVRLAVEVIRLHRRYADQPDSLMYQRTALFQRHDITPEQLERFIAKREQDLESWEPVLEYMKEKFEEGGDTLEVGRWGMRGGRYRKGGRDTVQTIHRRDAEDAEKSLNRVPGNEKTTIPISD